MDRRRFPSSKATALLLYHPDFAAVKVESGIAEQVACRKTKKIFLDCKVFNTSVDKFVEIVV
jgi:hypothetical protein